MIHHPNYILKVPAIELAARAARRRTCIRDNIARYQADIAYWKTSSDPDAGHMIDNARALLSCEQRLYEKLTTP